MIQEDYCSYEVAKLLKEKGFDESTSMVYTSYGDLCKLNGYASIRNSNYNDITKNCFEYTAPTHQMAMKWLREAHNISIEAFVDYGGDDYWWTVDISKIKKNGLITELSGYKTHEESVEAALKYSLENLILL